jgi:CRISPR-associated protein Cas1
VAVNFLSEFGYLQARMTGVADTSVTLRRAQFRAADDRPNAPPSPGKSSPANSKTAAIRCCAPRGKPIRPTSKRALTEATDALARQIQELGRWTPERFRPNRRAWMQLRGAEGMAAQTYFGVFALLLKQQREDFTFANRSRRPPRDRINCLLSFLYALVRHDCIAALTSVGLDPFVGFLHADRPNRPALALDLMEEFRPVAGRPSGGHADQPQTNRAGTFSRARRRRGGIHRRRAQNTSFKPIRQRKQETLHASVAGPAIARRPDALRPGAGAGPLHLRGRHPEIRSAFATIAKSSRVPK